MSLTAAGPSQPEKTANPIRAFRSTWKYSPTAKTPIDKPIAVASSVTTLANNNLPVSSVHAFPRATDPHKAAKAVTP